MTEKIDKTPSYKASSRAAEVREARLKAALKANIARRKEQLKLRGAEKNSSEAESAARSGQAPDNGKE